MTNYEFYIDTDTFPSTPGAYADAEKTVPMPRVIPLVQGFRGTLRVLFLGSRAPSAETEARMAFRPLGVTESAAATGAGTRGETDGGVPYYDFELSIDTIPIADALGKKETLTLRGGVVLSEGETRRDEYQLTFSVSATALGQSGATATVREALDAHDADPAAHPAIRAAVEAEAARAAEAESALGERISEEASAREQADAALEERLETEAAERERGDQANAEALAAETEAREQADALLRADISGADAVAEAPESDGQANAKGWVGALAALGCEGEEITPKRLTLCRRDEGSNTDGNNTCRACYLRVLRVVNGAWTVAYQSTNAVVAGDQPVAGQPLETWELRNTDGRGAIPASERIAIVQVLDAAAPAHESALFGCRTTSALGGILTQFITEDASAALVTANFAPAMRLEYASGGLRAALRSESAERERADAALEEKLAAETNRAQTAESALSERISAKADAAALADYATREWTNERVAEQMHVDRRVVESLPETGEDGVTYYVPKADADAEDDLYDAWIWLNGKWEFESSRRIDLSAYAKKTELTAETDRAQSAEAALGERLAALDDAFAEEQTRALAAESALSEKIEAETAERKSSDAALDGRLCSEEAALNAHVASRSNPHGVKFAQTVANFGAGMLPESWTGGAVYGHGQVFSYTWYPTQEDMTFTAENGADYFSRFVSRAQAALYGSVSGTSQGFKVSAAGPEVFGAPLTVPEATADAHAARLSQLSAETARASAAENALGSRIDELDAAVGAIDLSPYALKTELPAPASAETHGLVRLIPSGALCSGVCGAYDDCAAPSAAAAMALLENRISPLSGALCSEVLRAQAAEAALEAALAGKADASAIPDVSGLAEKTWVSAQIADALSGGEIDLSGYATNIALEAETSRATAAESALSSRIDALNAELGAVDLSPYALKTELPAPASAETPGLVRLAQSLEGTPGENAALSAAAAAALFAEKADASALDSLAEKTALEAETARAQAKESEIARSVSAEQTRATEAESALSARIDELDAALEAGSGGTVDLSAYAKLEGGNAFYGEQRVCGHVFAQWISSVCGYGFRNKSIVEDLADGSILFGFGSCGTAVLKPPAEGSRRVIAYEDENCNCGGTCVTGAFPFVTVVSDVEPNCKMPMTWVNENDYDEFGDRDGGDYNPSYAGRVEFRRGNAAGGECLINSEAPRFGLGMRVRCGCSFPLGYVFAGRGTEFVFADLPDPRRDYACLMDRTDSENLYSDGYEDVLRKHLGMVSAPRPIFVVPVSRAFYDALPDAQKTKDVLFLIAEE